MLLIKKFSAQTAQARVLYLCCLSCVIVLVFFFSYSLFPHLHLRALHIADSQSKIAPDFLAPFVPEGLGRPPEDDLFFSRPGGGSKSRPNGKGQPTYAIIMPTYVRLMNPHHMVRACAMGADQLLNRQNTYPTSSTSSSLTCVSAPTTKKSISTSSCPILRR